MAKDRISWQASNGDGGERRGPIAGDGGVADRLRDGGRSNGQSGCLGARAKCGTNDASQRTPGAALGHAAGNAEVAGAEGARRRLRAELHRTPQA